MSVHPTKPVALIVLAAFVTACDHAASPLLPSVAPSAATVDGRSSPSDVAPTDAAQVKLALNLVTSAQEQLELYINHPGPGDPNDHGDRNALDFFVKANGVLDALATSLSSRQAGRIHTDTAVEYAVMLALIIVVCITAIEETKPTCGVASCSYPRASDLYPQIVEQAQHTIDVATQLSAAPIVTE